MSGFTITETPATQHPVLWAAQSMVPGEPIFVLLLDDSSDGKKIRTVATTTLDWVRRKLYWVQQGVPLDEELDYEEMYVLLPKSEGLGLIKCDVGTAAGVEPGDGPRMVITNESGILWSCEL